MTQQVHPYQHLLDQAVEALSQIPTPEKGHEADCLLDAIIAIYNYRHAKQPHLQMRRRGEKE